MREKLEAGRPILLLIDDDDEIREQMKWALAADYTVLEAGDRPSAVDLFRRTRPILVTLDLGLPPNTDEGTEGLLTLEEILASEPLTKVIVITGSSDRGHALKAVQLGAYDYVHKPLQLDVLKVILSRANYLFNLERENRVLHNQRAQEPFDEILGASEQMQKVFETIRCVANADISVLIMGESGTGKELVARAIHRQSGQKDGPFVAINCGAIPDTLLESELFGHEKGAFTGAHGQRKGRIEAAQGGTLFLDEIGEVSPALQVKLLRFLQEHQIERVGGRGSVPVDVRVVAATNVDLNRAMKEGRFREDLYYRLCGVSLTIPPLRDRRGDVQMLAHTFVQRFSTQHQKKIAGFAKQALRALETYGWPGNVRELENRVKRAVIMAQGRQVTIEDLELDVRCVAYEGKRLKEARDALELELIEGALARHKGNISRAAEELGLTRPTMYDLMSKHGIRETPVTKQDV